uniref:Uncharacterized protein n=1 Tax=Vitis vinifera TaxID=29760 RepID=F6H938_VITVI
MAWTGLVG